MFEFSTVAKVLSKHYGLSRAEIVAIRESVYTWVIFQVYEGNVWNIVEELTDNNPAVESHGEVLDKISTLLEEKKVRKALGLLKQLPKSELTRELAWDMLLMFRKGEEE